MSNMNPKLDDYFSSAKKWPEEQAKLREIVIQCQVDEEMKWRQPCYTFQGKNIAIISGFNDYCAIGFFKGVLLKDPENILVQSGENTQSARIIRFTSVKEITEMAAVLKAYIDEAVEVEKAGLKVEFKKSSDIVFCEELQNVLEQDPSFKAAFEKLTPGRQRAYNLHFSSAKQARTREARIEKFMPRIFDGFGLNDCTCGHSKRMPGCDGSHKHFQ